MTKATYNTPLEQGLKLRMYPYTMMARSEVIENAIIDGATEEELLPYVAKAEYDAAVIEAANRLAEVEAITTEENAIRLRGGIGRRDA